MEVLIAAGMFGFQGLFLLFSIVAIIYLIFRRVKEKKGEDFEQRDN